MRRLALLTAWLLALAACGDSRAPRPAETVEDIARGLADGEIAVLWEALPPSYQRDVNGLVHRFARAVDPEVWNHSFAVLAKLARVLEEKHAFIVGHPALAAHLDRSAAGQEQGWSVVVETVELLATSEIGDVEKLAALDVGRFLDRTGVELSHLAGRLSTLSSEEHRAELEEQRASLRALKASVVAETGEGTATVRVERPGEAPRTEELVLVEGRWIPRQLAVSWPETVSGIREWLDELGAREPAAGRNLVLMKLRMVDAGLDALLEAGSAEEFEAGLEIATGMLAGAAIGAAASALAEARPEAQPLPSSSAASARSSPAASAPEPSAGSTERLREAFVPREIPVHQAHRWVGHELRVQTVDGLDKVARLKRVEDSVLHFRQPVDNGYLSFRLDPAEIENLTTIRR